MSLLDLDNRAVDLDYIKSIGFKPVLPISSHSLYSKLLAVNVYGYDFHIGYFYYNNITGELEIDVNYTAVYDVFESVVKKIQPADTSEVIMFIEKMRMISESAIKDVLNDINQRAKL